MKEMPLFPLNTVLFPGMPLQLHIFEERYKQMVGYCVDTGSPFGVVLIRQGQEANGPVAEPFMYGCSARITNLEPLDGGRYNLSAVGQERIRILTLKQDKPYLSALVQEFPLLPSEPDAMYQAMQDLRPYVEHYLRTLSHGEDVEPAIQKLPMDPVVYCYLGAVILQVPPMQKQPFLELSHCLDLLQSLHTVFRREVNLLDHLIASKPPEGQGSFSLN
jgi:Lon protease-like protein